MKKLFLASSFKDTANIFANFEENLRGKTVTFIPTASIVETVVFYVNSGKKAPELADFNALNLVNFYTVPHYTNAPFKKIAHKIVDSYSSALNLSPISNNEAILVESDNARIEKTD